MIGGGSRLGVGELVVMGSPSCVPKGKPLYPAAVMEKASGVPVVEIRGAVYSDAAVEFVFIEMSSSPTLQREFCR